MANFGQTTATKNLVNKRFTYPLVLFTLLLLAFTQAVASKTSQLTGEVVKITDGDTLTVLTSKKHQVKIRLAEIDTPERRQPYGTRARQALSDLAFHKQVRVVVINVDRYGRTVGRVYRKSDNLDVNAELIREGAAWVYRQYNKDKSLLTLESEAREAKRGLWSLPENQRIPPWEWRRHKAGK